MAKPCAIPPDWNIEKHISHCFIHAFPPARTHTMIPSALLDKCRHTKRACSWLDDHHSQSRSICPSRICSSIMFILFSKTSHFLVPVYNFFVHFPGLFETKMAHGLCCENLRPRHNNIDVLESGPFVLFQLSICRSLTCLQTRIYWIMSLGM